MVFLTAAPLRAESSSADSLRGTERELARNSNVLQEGGRVLLLPVYGAWRAVAWPLEQTTRLYDRSEQVQTVAELLVGGKELGPFRLSVFGGYESGEGFNELGLAAESSRWPRPEWNFQAKAGFIDRERNIATLELSTPEEQRLCLHLRSQFESKTSRRFHGVGPDSEARKLLYDARGALLESWVDIDLGHGTILDVATWYTRHDLDDIADRVDEPEESVAIQLPLDFALAEEVEYTGVALRLISDRRDSGAFSHRGHALEGEVGWNRNLRSVGSNYLHYRIQTQLFVPLSRRNTRSLALRAFAGGVQADDPSQVPFTEMERPGGRQGLRGYSRNRFADLRQLILSAEYRYRLTHRTRAALFTDWGSIASRWEDLRLDAIDPSYGFSLILGVERPTSLQVAFSPEGFQFSVGSETLFTLRSRRLR
jgi:Omp85 superfamily domain